MLRLAIELDLRRGLPAGSMLVLPAGVGSALLLLAALRQLLG